MDRVDGFYLTPFAAQPAVDRRRATAPRRGPRVERLLASRCRPTPTRRKVKVALAEAAGRSGDDGAAPALLALLKTDASQQVRLAALEALRLRRAATRRADADCASPTSRRRCGAPRSPSCRRCRSRRRPRRSSWRRCSSSGSTAEKQGALEVLGALKSPESRQALQGYLDELERRHARRPSLQVDLLDAVQADGSAALAKGARGLPERASSADTLVAGVHRGADPGRRLRARPAGASSRTRPPSARAATRSAAAAADVGPELTRIGIDADARAAGRGAGDAERAHRARLRHRRRSR